MIYIAHLEIIVLSRPRSFCGDRNSRVTSETQMRLAFENEGSIKLQPSPVLEGGKYVIEPC